MYQLSVNDDQLLALDGALCLALEHVRKHLHKRPGDASLTQVQARYAALLDYVVEVQGGAPLPNPAPSERSKL